MNGKRGDVERSKPARTEYFEYRTGLLIKEFGILRIVLMRQNKPKARMD
jgi:hypothetical protein